MKIRLIFLFQPYDAIFVSGDPTKCLFSPKGLVSYVEGGGHGFLEVGTGCCGGAAGEAATWNVFLAPFGFTLATTYNNIAPTVSVSIFQGTLPFGSNLFENSTSYWCGLGFACGVSTIYYENGQDISLVPPTQNGIYQLFYETIDQGVHGLYAAWKGQEPCVQRSSISPLVSGPHGTAYVPSAERFSLPNISPVPRGSDDAAGFWKQTTTEMEAAASCASNPA